jgi:dihydrofolate reductase
MGKLIVSEFMTLDGIIEDPGGADGTPNGGWSFSSPAPEGQQFKFEELLASDVQLLGRVTYEGFAAAWPQMEEGTGEFGKKMNSMPKVVVSTTLTDPAWNNTTVISSDVPAQVAKLKEQYEGDVLVSASATLVDTLRAHDLVDEYHLMVHPVILGRASACSRKTRPAPGWSWPTIARPVPTCCYSPTVRPGKAGGVPPTARHTRVAVRRGQFGGGSAPASARAYQGPVHIARATSRSASAGIMPSRRARSRMSLRRRRRGAMT